MHSIYLISLVLSNHLLRTHVNKLLINLAKIRQRFIYVEGLKFFKMLDSLVATKNVLQYSSLEPVLCKRPYTNITFILYFVSHSIDFCFILFPSRFFQSHPLARTEAIFPLKLVIFVQMTSKRFVASLWPIPDARKECHLKCKNLSKYSFHILHFVQLFLFIFS